MYNKYVWYKVFYKTYSVFTGKEYTTFEYGMNTKENPNIIENTIKKHGKNFVAAKEWII